MSSGEPGKSQEAVRAPRAPVTDRVNAEPAILNGMAATEAAWIAAASLVAFAVVGALVFAVTGLWQAVLALPLFGTGASLWFSSLYLQKVKRGRPEGYYTHAIHLWLADRGVFRSKFIRHQGYWSLGRTLDLSMVSSLDPGPEAVSTVSHPPASIAKPIP